MKPAKHKPLALDVRVRDTLPGDIPVLFAHRLEPTGAERAGFVVKQEREREAFTAQWVRQISDPGIVTSTILADGEIAGHVMCFTLDGLREIGYWLGEAYWGRGVAGRALRLFLAAIPERPLYAHTVASNAASIALLEKLGFRRVAELKRYNPARGGHYTDCQMRLD